MTDVLKNQAEYIIVGAGPAAICAIPNLLATGVNPNSIIWVDPAFCVGDFGSILSKGSSVPGNTSVESYQRVNTAIYKILADHSSQKQFAIDSLASDTTCPLNIAAEPLLHITNILRQLVTNIVGKVTHISTSSHGYEVRIHDNSQRTQTLYAKRVILATGSKAKDIKLPQAFRHLKSINPNITFIASELDEYLKTKPHINKIAVIGSSHSAALATMHLLRAGVHVKQFMNKEYKYAEPAISESGVKFTRHDNTGLKGEVAKFTRQLLKDLADNNSPYQNKISFHVGMHKNEVNNLLEQHLADCDEVIAAIGYTPNNEILVNGKPIVELEHDNKTTAFKNFKGLFGIGIAFPQEVISPSGETEFAVGVGKFWTTVSNPALLELWKTNHY